MMSDFQLKPGHFCIMFQESGSYLNVLFYFATTGGGRGASLYCQVEVEVQAPCLVLIDTWGKGGMWLLVIVEQEWEFQLPRWFPLAAWLGWLPLTPAWWRVGEVPFYYLVGVG